MFVCGPINDVMARYFPAVVSMFDQPTDRAIRTAYDIRRLSISIARLIIIIGHPFYRKKQNEKIYYDVLHAYIN